MKVNNYFDNSYHIKFVDKGTCFNSPLYCLLFTEHTPLINLVLYTILKDKRIYK